MKYSIKCKCRNCSYTFTVSTYKKILDNVKKSHKKRYAYENHTLIHKCTNQRNEIKTEYGVADIIAFYQEEN